MSQVKAFFLLAGILLLALGAGYVHVLQKTNAKQELALQDATLRLSIQNATISALEGEINTYNNVFTEWGKDRELISNTRAAVRSAVRDALAESESFKSWANTPLPPDLLPGGRLRYHLRPGENYNPSPSTSSFTGNPKPFVGGN